MSVTTPTGRIYVGVGLCQEAVRREHHPERRVHGERAACLLQGHKNRKDPRAQVSGGPSPAFQRPWELGKASAQDIRAPFGMV